ncbi:uncharacterized protein [Halyomorpha halys]|uniref:uncharacterized protein isoform X4 n=1 Tax=Halyomorpha halys TaxID=286706 RepID=UPI0034D327C7
MQDEFDFDKLPYHIKENIFKCLSFKDVADVCTVDLTWLSIANKVIRNCFFDLCKLTSEELGRLKGELKLLPRTALGLHSRLMILRSYYLLEMLLCELDLVKVVWKNILYNREGNTYSLGVLLDELYLTFRMYLNRPPQLQNLHSDRPSFADKKKILQFFINLVRINNRVTLREEQYNKETEFSLGIGNRDQDFINIEDMSIMNEVRDHLMTLVESNYELKRTDGLHEIMASFQSQGFTANTLDKGFSCYFHIICPLSEAPIHVINSWSKIKQKIRNKLLLDNDDENYELKELTFSQDYGKSSDEDDPPVQKPHSGETYVFGCTIKSSLLRHDITETSTLIIVEP